MISWGNTRVFFFFYNVRIIFSAFTRVSVIPWPTTIWYSVCLSSSSIREKRINFFVYKKLFQVRFGNETLPVFGPSSIESIGYLDLVVKLSLDLGAELGGSVGFVQVLNEVRVDDQPRLLVLA